VPSAWDAAWGTGLQYSRGVGVYRTRVSVPVGQPAALHFGACSLFCRVYVDKKLVHNHTLGGFTPFWVDVPSASAAVREIIVLASNIFDKKLTPTQAANYDFYQYGGLIRHVALHVLPADGLSLQRVEVLPLAKPGTETPSGEVNITVVLRPLLANLRRVRLQMIWDGGPASTSAATEYAVDADGKVSVTAAAVPNPAVWQPPSNPTAVPSLPLHTLTVRVSPLGAASAAAVASVTDAITVRFGLRIVSTAGREIRINGQPTKLKGFNRHDMYPQLGPSLPTAQYESDLAQIQLGLHANFLRGSHYPQDDRLLDLCDERGLLVWDEALAWGNYAPTLTDPDFLAAELGTANAMLDGGINHPSIVLWGFFNEGQSDDESAKPSYQAMADAFRSRDPSRLITWADNRVDNGKAYEYADVISFNRYPGWYNGPAEDINASWRGYAAWVAEHWPAKPFIISETGAGGIVGNHSDNATAPSRWSEEYESLVDGLDVSTAMECSNISGISLWQLQDIKVDQANSSSGRPGGINNKGVLSRWREPKLAAKTVADVYAGLA